MRFAPKWINQSSIILVVLLTLIVGIWSWDKHGYPFPGTTEFWVPIREPSLQQTLRNRLLTARDQRIERKWLKKLTLENSTWRCSTFFDPFESPTSIRPSSEGAEFSINFSESVKTIEIIGDQKYKSEIPFINFRGSADRINYPLLRIENNDGEYDFEISIGQILNNSPVSLHLTTDAVNPGISFILEKVDPTTGQVLTIFGDPIH